MPADAPGRGVAPVQASDAPRAAPRSTGRAATRPADARPSWSRRVAGRLAERSGAARTPAPALLSRTTALTGRGRPAWLRHRHRRERPRSGHGRLRHRTAPAAVRRRASAGKTNFLRLLARRIAAGLHARRRPGSCWSTTAAACSARCPARPARLRHRQAGTRRADAELRPGHGANGARPDVTPEQLRRRAGGRARGVRAGRRLRPGRHLAGQPAAAAARLPAAGPRHRPAPGAHPAQQRRRPGAVRAVPGPAARHRLARPDDVRRPGRVRCSAASGPRPCRPAAAG